MTPEELLKAENAFIRLSNQGVPVEEIAGRLGIEAELVRGWEQKLKSAIQNYDVPDNLTVTVQEINEKGEYLYQNSIQLNFSGVEKLKFDLWRLSTGESSNPTVQKLIKAAGEYLIFAEAHLTYFNYKYNETGEKIDYSFRLNSDTIELRDKLRDMMKFYANYIDREYLHSKSVLIVNITQDYFSDFNAILPYSLKTILIKNFQGISSTELHYLPVDASWVFILGDNGYGKSIFLQAIAVGLFGNKDEERNLTDNKESKIGIEFKKSSANSINNLWALDFQSLEHIACYGPSRLQIQAKMSQNEVAERSSTTYGLFNPDGILLNIESKLIEWYIEKNLRFEQTKAVFKRIIPSLDDIIVRKNEQDDYEVLYIEQAEDEEQATFDPVSFDKLAAGFRSIIGLVGDLLIRFIRKQPEVTQLSDLGGIALIDELENHLHPKWQYRLPTLLSEVFPNIQFIAATHSVIPILGAPKNAVFLKLNRSKEQGITVERVDIDVANLLPNSILTSPIFDMDTIKPLANEDASKLRTEDTFDEVVAHDEVDKQLRDLDDDPSKYPALLQE